MRDNKEKYGRDLHIGGVSIDNPFILAPMAGITDSPFRLIARSFGCGLAYSEMISAKGLYYNDQATEKLLHIREGEKPVAYQIFGSDPEFMSLAAKKLECRENVILDINMGCPVPKVVKGGDGSALMTDPDLAGRVIEAVVSSTTKPVTVKIRAGWSRDSINAVEIAMIAEQAGAAAVGIHGRTRDQYYSGKADWSHIARIREKVGIKVIGSGDVFSGRDANRMLIETGCDFVMIARGALGNPWIFREALAIWRDEEVPTAPGLDEKARIIRKQLDLLMEDKGEYAAVREMRKHISWYLKGVHGAADLRRRVNSLEKYQQIAALLSELSRADMPAGSARSGENTPND